MKNFILLVLLCLTLIPFTLRAEESNTEKTTPPSVNTETKKDDTETMSDLIEEGELLEDDLKYLNQGL